ncbi:hypothetical protein LJR231_000609 [Phyllobacterium sp. LjRoot231]|uniref:hypothetical protein n=1 Tax=Phyllobacterium sp. LjRoot231 TaxID=3342289 RepID=UPI003ED131D9
MASDDAAVAENSPEGRIIKKDLITSTWIGFSAAVDWIACRGHIVPESDARMDVAIAALLAELLTLEPTSCQAVVEGVSDKSEGRMHRPLPYGIWPHVRLPDQAADLRFYLLDLVDNESEWGGRLVLLDGESYEQLRIRSSFILQRWLPGVLEIDPAQQVAFRQKAAISAASKFSEPAIRAYVEAIVHKVPERLGPLRIWEVERLVHEMFPGVPRQYMRAIFREIRPAEWPSVRGVHGSKTAGRREALQKFSHELRSAELPN